MFHKICALALFTGLMWTQVTSMSTRHSSGAKSLASPRALVRRSPILGIGEAVEGFTNLGTTIVDHAGRALEREHIEHLEDRRYHKNEARRRAREEEVVSNQIGQHVDTL